MAKHNITLELIQNVVNGMLSAEVAAKMADILRESGVPDLTDKFRDAVRGADHGKRLLNDGARQEIIRDINAAKPTLIKQAAADIKPAVMQLVRGLPETCREPPATSSSSTSRSAAPSRTRPRPASWPGR